VEDLTPYARDNSGFWLSNSPEQLAVNELALAENLALFQQQQAVAQLPNQSAWENTMFMLANHPGTQALQQIAKDQASAQWWQKNQIWVLAASAAAVALIFARSRK
jgi:hypothetical protein